MQIDKFFEILRKYNFWDGEDTYPGVLRSDYLPRISEYLGNRLVKVITGQRRTGKSYLIRQIIIHLHRQGTNPANILYINREIADFDFIRDQKDLHNIVKLYLTRLKPEGRVFLFFDEIQLVSNWEQLINSYSQDYTEEFEVFVSGSNSSLLSGEMASLLSGRYITFQVFSYSFKEYCRANALKASKKSFLEYLKGGGMPELSHLKTEEIKQHYLSDLKNTIVLRDIIMRHKVKDIGLLDLLFAFIVQNISNPVSINNIVNYLGSINITTNFNTISSYIEYLKQTFVIWEVPRYDMRGKKILGGTRKYYLNDLSFRNYLYPGFEPGLGYLLENAVFLEFKRNGYEIFTGSYRNREVDFVIKKGEILKYAQVTYMLTNEKVVEREFNNLVKIRDNYDKMVISLDDVSLGNYKGIKHYPAWQDGIFS